MKLRILENQFLYTFYIQSRSLFYILENFYQIIYSFLALSVSILVLSIILYIFYLKYGVHPFDETTIYYLKEISLVESSSIILLCVIFYFMITSFLENIVFGALILYMFNKNNLLINLYSSAKQIKQIFKFSLTFSLIAFLEENIILRAITYCMNVYLKNLGIELRQRKLEEFTAYTLISFPILINEKLILNNSFEKSKTLLMNKFGNNITNPKFSFKTWDLAFLLIIILGFITRAIFAFYFNKIVGFVILFLAIQLLVTLFRNGKIIFATMLYKYCNNIAIPEKFKELIENSY